MSGITHIGPKGPSPCKAQPGNCPFGGEHFDSEEAAQEAYEKQMSCQTNVTLSRANEGSEDAPADPHKSEYAKGWEQGTHHYENVVMGSIPSQEFSRNPQSWLKANPRKSNQKTVIVPNVKRLSDKKRIQIARELYKTSGRDMERWEKASESEKLSFGQRYLGRYGDAEVTVHGDKVDWTTRTTTGNSHDLDDVTLLDFNKKPKSP